MSRRCIGSNGAHTETNHAFGILLLCYTTEPAGQFSCVAKPGFRVIYTLVNQSAFALQFVI